MLCDVQYVLIPHYCYVTLSIKFLVPLFICFDHLRVGRKPVDGIELVPRQPFECLMFFQSKVRGIYRTQETLHREMELRIIVIHHRQQILYCNFSTQFLFNLALQSLLRRFA